MKTLLIVLLAVLSAGSNLCHGQVSGNIGYAESGGRSRAVMNERSKRTLTKYDLPPTESSMFVEANVLMNVKADEYVAVFGVAQEGATVAECHQNMDAALQTFFDALRPLKIDREVVFVDFVTQNKIYGYEVVDDVARERLVGFELKKNIAIRYQDPSLLDKLVVAAASAQIFDLIKVDYVVKDLDRIRDQLMEESARVLKQRAARYEQLLGIKLQPPAQIYAERSAVYYPTRMYDSYTAHESEEVGSAYYRQKHTTLSARKSTTFFFNGLDADGFDAVINPVTVEPMVQFTFFLKVKYEAAAPRVR